MSLPAYLISISRRTMTNGSDVFYFSLLLRFCVEHIQYSQYALCICLLGQFELSSFILLLTKFVIPGYLNTRAHSTALYH